MTSAPHFVTVYEFSPFLVAGWPFFLGGLILPIVFFVFFWRTMVRDRPFSAKLFITLIFAGLFFNFGRGALISIHRHSETMSKIEAGSTLVLEGMIRDTHCVGKGRQAFTIGTEKFETSETDFQPGFESARTFANSVLDGMHVRVRYFNSSWGVRIITKLENDTTTGITPPGVKMFGPCGA